MEAMMSMREMREWSSVYYGGGVQQGSGVDNRGGVYNGGGMSTGGLVDDGVETAMRKYWF